MRRLGLLLALAVLGVAAWGLAGGADLLVRHAADAQRAAQGALAHALRALRAGEPGALASLWALCLLYGVAHAAGPGHGKLVIGGYGLGRRVALRRLAGLALASSLAQAATAVALVGAGVVLLGLGREEVEGLAADRRLALVSAALVASVGAWLLLRGARSIWRLRPRPAPAPAGHDPTWAPSLLDEDEEVCAACGHAHGPTLAQAAAVGTPREALALVAAIALRPCSGALILLVLTWRMGVFAAGVGGAFAMGLGTAAVTAAVAAGAVALREGALGRLATGPGLARGVAGAEAAAGALVILVALRLMLPSG